MQDFDWSTLLAFLGVVSLVVGASTTYLKLFVGKQISTLKDQLNKDFMPREVVTQRFEALEKRLDQVEDR